MTDQRELFDELQAVFEEAAALAKKAWEQARVRNEEARQDNETYRMLVAQGAAALDALTRAIKNAWETAKTK